MDKTKTNKFNIWAAIFQIFYYLYKGLWRKGLLLFAIVAIISAVTQMIIPNNWKHGIDIGISVALFGVLGSKDVKQKVENNETMWKNVPAVLNKGIVIITIAAIAFVINLVAISHNTSESNIEESAKPIVTNILKEQYESDLEADDVTITEEGDNNTYNAIATLSNGTAIRIKIEYYPSKDRIYVEIPYTEGMKIYN